jgi:hypothetical protein
VARDVVAAAAVVVAGLLVVVVAGTVLLLNLTVEMSEYDDVTAAGLDVEVDVTGTTVVMTLPMGQLGSEARHEVIV